MIDHVKLEQFKKLNRIDHDVQDDVIMELLRTAEDYVVSCTNRDICDLTEEGDGDLPRPLIQAVYLVAAHWYENPSGLVSAGSREVPVGVWALINRYISLV